MEQFLRAAHAEGLCELDHPGSTRVISDFSLFRSPNVPFPSHYGANFGERTRPQAMVSHEFFRQGLKLPVWAFRDEQTLLNQYCDGLRKVCRVIRDSPQLLANLDA